jgi:hypothetical protein
MRIAFVRSSYGRLSRYLPAWDRHPNSGLHARASSHGSFGSGARCYIQEGADTAEIRESVAGWSSKSLKEPWGAAGLLGLRARVGRGCARVQACGRGRSPAAELMNPVACMSPPGGIPRAIKRADGAGRPQRRAGLDILIEGALVDCASLEAVLQLGIGA